MYHFEPVSRYADGVICLYTTGMGMYKVLCKIEASPSGRDAGKARYAVCGGGDKQMRQRLDSIRLGLPILGDLLLRRADRRVVDLSR